MRTGCEKENGDILKLKRHAYVKNWNTKMLDNFLKKIHNFHFGSIQNHKIIFSGARHTHNFNIFQFSS